MTSMKLEPCFLPKREDIQAENVVVSSVVVLCERFVSS
jgi:hypothetical protein